MISLEHDVAMMHGDVAHALPLIPTDSCDAVVTDPPYALAMGGGTEGWDSYKTPAAFAAWCASWGAEALRITKPGGWLVAAGSARTWHRLAQGLEDAGWDILDSIDWVYSTSFHRAVDIPARLAKAGYGEEMQRLYADRATFIKSRHEPFVLARAPLDGTLLSTIAEHGTATMDVVSTGSDSGGPCNVLLSHDEFCIEGGVCVPGCPVALAGPHAPLFPAFRWDDKPAAAEKPRIEVAAGEGTGKLSTIGEFRRWRCRTCGVVTGSYMRSGAKYSNVPHVVCDHSDQYEPIRVNDYVDTIMHNTMKPLSLNRWFVRLLTMPGARVLEPFGGSHSTVEACILEDRKVVSVERDRTSVDLGGVRLRRNRAQLAGTDEFEVAVG